MYAMKTYGFTKEEVATILADHLECNVGEAFGVAPQITLSTENASDNPHIFKLIVGGSSLLDIKGIPAPNEPNAPSKK